MSWKFHEPLLDADTFEDLPGEWQAAIIEAEWNRPKLRLASGALPPPNEVRLVNPCFEGSAAASLRPLVVDVEDEFRLGVRRLASAQLVYRRVQILSHEALEGFARIPALDDSPRPFCLSPGMERQSLVDGCVTFSLTAS